MKSILYLFIVVSFLGTAPVSRHLLSPDLHAVQPPALFTGNFVDDYGIRYQINDTLWMQGTKTKFHIIKWNLKEQYLIARNDAENPGDKNLYTRIDMMKFDNMQPWLWGYCLTVYDAKTDMAAEAIAIADRKNPRKGCNGFPFSRMKKIE